MNNNNQDNLANDQLSDTSRTIESSSESVDHYPINAPVEEEFVNEYRRHLVQEQEQRHRVYSNIVQQTVRSQGRRTRRNIRQLQQTVRGRAERTRTTVQQEAGDIRGAVIRVLQSIQFEAQAIRDQVNQLQQPQQQQPQQQQPQQQQPQQQQDQQQQDQQQQDQQQQDQQQQPQQQQQQAFLDQVQQALDEEAEAIRAHLVGEFEQVVHDEADAAIRHADDLHQVVQDSLDGLTNQITGLTEQLTANQTAQTRRLDQIIENQQTQSNQMQRMADRFADQIRHAERMPAQTPQQNNSNPIIINNHDRQSQQGRSWLDQGVSFVFHYLSLFFVLFWALIFTFHVINVRTYNKYS